MLSIHQNIWKGDEDSPGFLFFAGAPVCSQHQQRAVLEMCLEMCIQPCQCCSSGLCPILSDMAMPCSCYLGSEISWLLGRSGLAGIPASAPSQESGTGHAAWGSHEGRESTGAVAQCPIVCCGIFLHYTHPKLWTNTDLAAQELERFQGLLHLKTSDELEAPHTAGRGSRSICAASQRTCWT